MMKIGCIMDDNTDFIAVRLKENYNSNRYTPHCDKHGAMNKVSSFNEGGYWRCLQGQCRSGCIEIK